MKKMLTGNHALFSMTFLTCALLILPVCVLADISTTGQVRNQDNTFQWDWNTYIPGSTSWIVIGYDGTGTLYLDNTTGSNGITDIRCERLIMGHQTGASGTMTMSGNGANLLHGSPFNMYIANGENSTGSFTVRDGTNITFETYQESYIFVGNGIDSKGTMTLRGSGTLFRLSDDLRVGLNDGSHGEFIVEDGAVFESLRQSVGHYAGSYGKITVDGPGSQAKTGNTRIGLYGTGELVIQNHGYVQTGDSAQIGVVNGAHGTAEVTGAGSRWEVLETLFVGRGSVAAEPNYGVGILKLARGGKVEADILHVGYNSPKPHGTLDFIIGNTGTGAVNCGLIETSSILLDIAYLKMHIDPGVNLTVGTQYTLVDYEMLGSGASYAQFIGINEGDIYTSPEGYHFRINYATNLGGGDLGITATVTELPPCVVDDVDLYLLYSHWLETGCTGSDWCNGADLDYNDNVDLGDFAYIAQNWLSSCPGGWPWQ